MTGYAKESGLDKTVDRIIENLEKDYYSNESKKEGLVYTREQRIKDEDVHAEIIDNLIKGY